MSTGKNKLITFGCSFTYGHGFPDCDEVCMSADPNTPASKHAWPNYVASDLGMDLLNLSSPGCGCYEVGRRFMRNVHRISKDDIVVIQWPFIERWPIVFGSGYEDVCKLAPGLETLTYDDITIIDVEKYFIDYTTDYHNLEIFMHTSTMVDQVCKNKGISVIHSMFDSDHRRMLKQALKSEDYEWYDVKIERLAFNYLESKPKRKLIKFPHRKFQLLSDGHYGKDYHELWAESIKRKIVRRDLLNT